MNKNTKAFIKTEVKNISAKEIGYAYSLSQVKYIQKKANLPTEAYSVCYDKLGTAMLREISEKELSNVNYMKRSLYNVLQKIFNKTKKETIGHYMIKPLMSKKEFINFKNTRIKSIEVALEKKIPVVLKKKIMRQSNFVAVNKVLKETCDFLTSQDFLKKALFNFLDKIILSHTNYNNNSR